MVVNGCSLTRGQELADPEREAWPRRLADLLGTELVNLARDGGSNRRIVRTSVQEIPALVAKSGVSASNVTVIAMWTHLARSEYYNAQEPETYTEGGQDREADRGWHRVGPWRQSEGHQPSRAFYEHLWSQHGQATGFVLEWMLLDAFLVSLGYRVRYAFGFPVDKRALASVRHLTINLDPARTFGGRLENAASFIELAERYPRGRGGHPLADAHASYAALVAAWLGGRGLCRSNGDDRSSTAWRQ
ncbi:MAG: DUF6071 family protein [Solirubrobacteraceae bacterium]